MKLTIVFLVVAITCVSARSQGTILFDTHIPGVVDARVTLPDTSGVGAGWTAQLFAGPVGSHRTELMPLFPTTTFKTGSSADLGYVNPVVVTVPNLFPGTMATVLMGISSDTQNIFRESGPINIVLGGSGTPPAVLTGLSGFGVIPEPSTISFFVIGVALLGACNRIRKTHTEAVAGERERPCWLREPTAARERRDRAAVPCQTSLARRR